jgi:CRISPR-associated endonuclease/helicase Cas3
MARTDSLESNDALEFRRFFCDALGLDCAGMGRQAGPYDWQVRVAIEGIPDVLPIPTGLGKTEGAALAWAWRRLSGCSDEPLHLVYCLPMRTLVTQTVKRLRKCFNALAAKRPTSSIPVYQLMGGVIDDGWASSPDRPWVLVGTQDQLLSRALNRGYAMSRFEWPMHFGLLNQDCHWIVDEVQLMGPGLWTTSQLDWMRRKRFQAVKPCRTTWMSATVGEGFLATADRKRDGLDKVKPFDPRLDEDENEELRRRRSAVRHLEWFNPSSRKHAPDIHEQIGTNVVTEHRDGTLSLVVCNTVKDAQDVFRSLPGQPPKILLTSRFRRDDRINYEQELLDFEDRRRESGSGQIEGDPGLVCVSTQVVEAGLDISAHRLWSQLAPWPSVIQRLGRLNRDGRDNDAGARFWQPAREQERKRDGETWVGPYLKRDIAIAKTLADALAPYTTEMPFSKAIVRLEETQGELLHAALQPKRAPWPRALDAHGLFSTEPDLHGGFTDVSAFVRNSDPDADVTVFWRVWRGARPARGEALDGPPFASDGEGCPVSVYHLCEMLKQRAKAWIWNDEGERWEACAARDLRPGMTVMLHRDVGGYSTRLGWTGNRADVLQDVQAAGPGRALAGDEQTEASGYVALSVHLRDARTEAERICEDLGLSGDIGTAVVEAAAFHDIGKSHPKWQSTLPAGGGAQGGPWAKCPCVLGLDVPSADRAFHEEVTRLRPSALALPAMPGGHGGVRMRWVVDRKLSRKELEALSGLARWAGHEPFRPGMRHEAASALAMWNRYREGGSSYPALAVYLAVAHHGKVRTVLRSTMQDGDDVFGVSGQPDSLVINGECWPLDFSVAADGASGEWSGNDFVLTDYGWTGLVADLLGPWRSHEEDRSNVGAVPENEPRRLGPFALAWLEALVRVADWRASASPSESITPREVLRGK